MLRYCRSLSLIFKSSGNHNHHYHYRRHWHGSLTDATFHELISDGWGNVLTIPPPSSFKNLEKMHSRIQSLNCLDSKQYTPTMTFFNYRLMHLIQQAVHNNYSVAVTNSNNPSSPQAPSLATIGRRIFELLKELELNAKLTPDMRTFEWLLWFLAHIPGGGFSMAAEEVFQLMSQRYDLTPSDICWEARLVSWLWKSTEGRAIFLLEELRNKGHRRVASAHRLYSRTASVALGRGLYNYVQHLLSCVTPIVQKSRHNNSRLGWEVILPGISPTNPSVILSSRDYLSFLASRRLTSQLHHPTVIKITRFLLLQLLPSLEMVPEAILAHLLYASSSIGNVLADIAFLAFKQLRVRYMTHRGDSQLPRTYVEAFVDCIRRPTNPNLSVESGLEEMHLEMANQLEKVLETIPNIRPNYT